MKNSEKFNRIRTRNGKKKRKELFEDSELINLIKDVALYANKFDDVNKLTEISFENIHRIVNWPVSSLWVSNPENSECLIFGGSCFIEAEYSPNDLVAHFKKTEILKNALYKDGILPETKYFLFDVDDAGRFGDLLDHKKLSAINSLLFIPVLIENNLAGSLLFMSDNVIHENKILFSSLETISSIIARVMERIQKERELVRSKNQFEAAQELAQLGTWEMELPSQRLYWSEELYKIFKKKRGDFNLSLRMFESLIHPADIDKFKEALDNAIDKQVKIDLLLRILSPEENDRFLHMLGGAVLDAEGKFIGIRGVGRDVTTEQKAKELSFIREQQLNEAQTIAGLGYWEWDIESNKVIWSDELYRIFGLEKTMEELTINTYLNHLYKEDRERSRSSIFKALNEKAGFTNNERILLTDGSIRYIKSGGKTYLNPEGIVLKMMGICYDVTEIRKNEMEIQQINAELEDKVLQRTHALEMANMELESFAGSVSHDLKSPLRAIFGFTELLYEKCHEHADLEIRDLLSRIKASTERMITLVDDLLIFSRASKSPMNKVEINFSDFVLTIVNQIKKDLESKNKINLEKLPDTKADPSLIRQVFINLISNAIKFSSRVESPLIEIGGYNNGDNNIYYVKDNGVGFNMKYYDKLFGAFQRLHSEAEFEGTGLGLALSKRIVERHGGKIWSESAGENKGATFYFSLPVERKNQ